jgi:hypothetical protein
MVFWDVLYLAILVPLFLWMPGHRLFGEINIHLGDAGLLDYLNALFGISEHPVGFQFWFIRDLFTTVLISPLLWLSLKKAPWLGMAVLGIAWLLGSHLVIFFRTDVVFFFYIGGFLRIRRIPLHIGRGTAWSLMALYIALVALRTMAPLVLDLAGSRPEILTAATRSMRVLGVIACWGVFLQLASTRFGTLMASFGGLAFFLHSIHFPLIAEVKILLWPLLPAQTDGWLIAHYLASVTITVVIGLSAGLLLAAGAPGVFALMNGGRPGTGPQGRQTPLSPIMPLPPASLTMEKRLHEPDESGSVGDGAVLSAVANAQMGKRAAPKRT